MGNLSSELEGICCCARCFTLDFVTRDSFAYPISFSSLDVPIQWAVGRRRKADGSKKGYQAVGMGMDSIERLER